MSDIGFAVVDGVLLVCIDGVSRKVPALWLRERTQDPAQLDLVSDQRTFDPHLLDPDLAIVEASVDAAGVTARFSDGHVECFDERLLTAAISGADACPAPVAWDASLGSPPRHLWQRVDDAGPGLADALHDLLVYGAIVVHGVPTTEGAVLEVARRFGHVRTTNFGELFEVRSIPDSNDLAYRSIALGPHTDNPYREPVPGMQLLHCLVNETSGGVSTLVDAVAVTDRIREEDPGALRLLCDTVVRFTWRDDTAQFFSYRPVAATDHLGRVTGLHYSPKLDHLPLMTEESTREYQRARVLLARLLVDPEFQISFRLEPGETLVFSNDRVLHGRTAYDTAEGHRHLQGCYIDHDEPRSRYRSLVRRGAGG